MLALAGIRPVVLAEVDDMAVLRQLAREGLVPPIVVLDELRSGALVERCRVPGVTESFYAIVQDRRFPNRLLADLLAEKSASSREGPLPYWPGGSLVDGACGHETG